MNAPVALDDIVAAELGVGCQQGNARRVAILG